MSILAVLIVGFVTGVLAKFIMLGAHPGGFIITIVLGIAGAFAAGYLGPRAGWYSSGERIVFLASVVGAFALLFAYRLLFHRMVAR